MNDQSDLKDLRRKAASGAFFTAGAQGFKLALQILSVVLLSRLLAPADFGLIAMISPIVHFVMLFGDLGLNQAVITAKEVNRRQLNTIFWVNVGFAASLFLLLALTAPLVGQFYGEPGLVDPLRVLAATVLIAALGIQQQALVTRGLKFTRIAAVEVTAATLGFLAALGLAYTHPSVWALVAGTVVTAATTVAAYWLLSDWRPGFSFHYREAAGLIRFGKGMLGFNVANFFSRNLDNVLIGHYAGAVQLGYYDRAYKLLLFPLSQINNPVGRVVVPMLSKLVDDPERYRRVYVRTVQQLALFTIPGVVFLVVNAGLFIPTILGEKWAPSVPIFMVLGLAAIHQPISATTGWLFISQSRTGEYAQWGLVVAVTSIGAFVVGLPWGALGVATAYALSDILIRLPIVWWWVGRRGPVSSGTLFSLAWPMAVAAAAAAAVLYALLEVRLFAPTLVDLGARAVITYAVAWGVLLVLPQGRSALGELVATARSVLAKRRKKTAA
jgi:PST family polysaccharide transporter